MPKARTTDPTTVHYQIPKRGGLGAVLACLLAGQAAAQDGGPWYARAALTGSSLEKPKQTIANAPTPGSTLQVVNDVDFGWGGDVALGRSFGRVRVEGEIGRTHNKSGAYSVTSPLTITLPQSGRTDATRVMANAYVDLVSKDPWRVFVGAGVGQARLHVTTFAAPARAPTAPPSQLLNYRDDRFAYQLMGGVSYALTSAVSVSGQYRWFDAGKAAGHDARGERATREVKGSNFDVGLTYAF